MHTVGRTNLTSSKKERTRKQRPAISHYTELFSVTLVQLTAKLRELLPRMDSQLKTVVEKAFKVAAQDAGVKTRAKQKQNE